MRKSSPLIYDVTLRDGSHANRHAFTSEFCEEYIDKANAAGIHHIEIGHGNGLGGSSLHIGILQDQDIWKVVEKKSSQYDDLKLGVHVIPGLATFNDIDEAMKRGIKLFRVGCHCTEADTTETYIEYAANKIRRYGDS